MFLMIFMKNCESVNDLSESRWREPRTKGDEAFEIPAELFDWAEFYY